MDGLRSDPGRRFYVALLDALVQVMGTAKGYLFGHGPKVAMLSSLLAEHLEVESGERSEIFFAAMLSDLGMIGLVEDAWENPVQVLPPAPRSIVVQHPTRSEHSVSQIPHLGALAPLIRHHHEWWDGSGYPDGLAGSDIPLGAQILRLADTVVALNQDRPHRKAFTQSQILEIVRESTGKEFGPDLASAYLQLAAKGPFPSFHAGLFHRACLVAAAEVVPEKISPLSTGEFLEIIAGLIDAKDPYTAGHSRRVAGLAAGLAERMGLPARVRETTWQAGCLHDLGKVSVPLSVLTKPGPLDDVERERIQAHAATGADILSSIDGLKHLSSACRYHHERWDGGGYPEGLSGDRIPIVAQMLSVCDTYDAMTSSRAYRPARSHEEAVDVIAGAIGLQFGPLVAHDFLSMPRDVFADVWQPEKTVRSWLFRPSDSRRKASGRMVTS